MTILLIVFGIIIVIYLYFDRVPVDKTEKANQRGLNERQPIQDGPHRPEADRRDGVGLSPLGAAGLGFFAGRMLSDDRDEHHHYDTNVGDEDEQADEHDHTLDHDEDCHDHDDDNSDDDDDDDHENEW